MVMLNDSANHIKNTIKKGSRSYGNGIRIPYYQGKENFCTGSGYNQRAGKTDFD
jgi:hypothetical protein